MSSVSNTDPFLIVGIAILILVLIVINIYVIVKYQHPEDRNQSYFCKLLIIFGFLLSTFAILLIPVDVANNAGNPGCDLPNQSSVYCGGVNFFTMWESLFCMCCFIIVGLIPFSTFYYEGSFSIDGTKKPRGVFFSALGYEMVVLIAFLVLVLPLYFSVALTKIPVINYDYSLSALTSTKYYISPGQTPYDFVSLELPASDFKSVSNFNKKSINFDVNFAVYLIALAGFIGFWIFSVFVGVGITSLPFDLIIAYIYRPKVLAPDELAERELELQNRTNEIIDIAVLLKKDHQVLLEGGVPGREKRKRMLSDRLETNKLAQMVYLLEKDVELLRNCKNIRNQTNPFIPYIKLGVGIIFILVSALWLLQIILYMLTDDFLFLNAYLTSFDTWFPMFGIITYALLSIYLLLCTVIGCFKVGLRFLCIKIYPMEVNNTYVNGFLFNLAIIMICTIPIVNFCTVAFSSYAVNSDAFLLFNVKIRYLTFYTIFQTNNVFIWIVLLSACVTIPYLFCRPRDTATSPTDMKSSLNKRGIGYLPVSIELANKK